MRRLAGLSAVALAILMPAPARADSAKTAPSAHDAPAAKPPEPDGYRLDAYRAPVPATLRGATVLDTLAALALWREKRAVFIDALPQPPRPAGIPKDAVFRQPPRFDIPGSVWLPDTGYGELAEPTLRYFEQGLARATASEKTRPLVFYCLKNCWMSWNAAKRALTLGYANVFWYPDGSDGWAEAGNNLELRQPEPRL